MKVQISYTVNADDSYRRAINNHYGRAGLATRQQVQSWVKRNGASCDDDIAYELQREEEEKGIE